MQCSTANGHPHGAPHARYEIASQRPRQGEAICQVRARGCPPKRLDVRGNVGSDGDSDEEPIELCITQLHKTAQNGLSRHVRSADVLSQLVGSTDPTAYYTNHHSKVVRVPSFATKSNKCFMSMRLRQRICFLANDYFPCK